MTTALEDADIRSVVENYRTAELATLSRSGAPLAWPASARYQPETGTFMFTTAIGFPQKAYNIRRDGRVALLFSDPTGSGLESMPEVLVQGRATCTEHIVTSPSGHPGLEDWWLRLWTLQPNGRSLGADPISRRLMEWYYQRLVITVTPSRVHVRPPLSQRGGTDPRHAETPRRGSTSGEAAAAMAGFDSAVLAARDPDGVPWLLRVRPELDPTTGVFRFDVPAGEPVEPGSASLLCHFHDEQIWNMRSVIVVGELGRREEAWEFRATRLVPGASTNPVRMVQTVLGCRRSARQYLQRRGLTPPPVDWAAFDALKRAVKQRPATAATHTT